MADEAPLLELKGITKRFPGVVANDHVDFDLRRGEVHALLGENGAGKSTLMNVLYGLYRPDEGEILVNGKPVEMSSPRDAIDLGIGMVHQHFMLIPVMTVAENIVLGVEPTREKVFLDEDAAEERVEQIARSFRFAIDPHARIEDISVGQQQRVEILKALFRGAEILILDEPTAVLTPQEALELFGILRTLTREGMSVIFISHKLHEVLEIADRVTVLRRGKKIETLPREGATQEQLAKLMVGREVFLRVDKKPAEPGEPLLEVEDLHVLDQRGLPAVQGVSFEVRAGEIVGLAGVDGNGQTELIDALTGLAKAQSGAVRIAGEDVTRDSTRERFDEGIGHIPGGPAASRARPRLHARRERRAPRVPTRAQLPIRLVAAEASDRARTPPLEGVRRPRRDADHTRLGALRGQSAEGRHRPRGRARPTRARGRPADERPGRRRDRVRPQPARRGA